MIFDSLGLLSDKQEISTTTVSENVIDFIKEVSGVSSGINLSIRVNEAFAGTGTVKVAVETADSEDFSDKKILVETGAVAGNDLDTGYTFPITGIPHGMKRYGRLAYTVNGTITPGKITAGTVTGIQTNGI